MSLVNPKPAGWAVNDTVTSAQMNLFGQEIAKALDKTTAGDILAGQIQMIAGAAINAQGGAAQITTDSTAGIQSQFNGGLSLAGGSSDWPTFHVAGGSTAAPRTRTLWVPGSVCRGVSFNVFVGPPNVATTIALGTTGQPFLFDSYGGAGPVIQNGIMETLVVSSVTNRYAYLFPLDTGIHSGATISTVTMTFIGGTLHTSLPSNMPALAVYRVDSSGNVAALASGTAWVLDSSANVTAYKASHSITFTANQNNVVDRSQYSYFAILYDESGTNTQVNNTVVGLSVSNTAITSLQFP